MVIWVGKIPWRKKWQPTPVLLPGKSHGQRSLAGYSPWDHEELDTTEQLTHRKSLAVSYPRRRGGNVRGQFSREGGKGELLEFTLLQQIGDGYTN